MGRQQDQRDLVLFDFSLVYYAVFVDPSLGVFLAVLVIVLGIPAVLIGLLIRYLLAKRSHSRADSSLDWRTKAKP